MSNLFSAFNRRQPLRQSNYSNSTVTSSLAEEKLNKSYDDRNERVSHPTFPSDRDGPTFTRNPVSNMVFQSSSDIKIGDQITKTTNVYKTYYSQVMLT